MRIVHVLKYILLDIKIQKTRALLTMLGIIIGVATVISIMAIGESAQDLLLSQVEALGSNLIGVLPGGSEEGQPPAALFGIEITTLTYDDALALGKLPHIAAISPYVTGQGTMIYLGQAGSFNYSGVGANYPEVEDTSIESGRFIKEDEVDSLARVVVLGSKVREDLFGNDDPLGKKIKINQITFQVIGVMKERGSAALQNQDQQVFVPIKTAQKILLGIDYLNFIRAKVVAGENMDSVVTQFQETLRFRHHIKDPLKDDFTVRNTAQALDILGTVTQALKMFLAAVAGISLIVGGIGIMNIMFVTVTERTKEIGLRKAVGAKRKDILIQFLIESATITSIGGAIGIVTGILISLAVSIGVNYFGYNWKFIVTPPSIAMAVLMAIGVGIAFGLWPANRASKMESVEALRK